MALSIEKSEKKAMLKIGEGRGSNETFVTARGSDIKPTRLSEFSRQKRIFHDKGNCEDRQTDKAEERHDEEIYQAEDKIILEDLNAITCTEKNSTTHSIFDLKSESSVQKGVTLPHIAKIFESPPEHIVAEKETKSYSLPTIQEGAANCLLEKDRAKARRTTGLFDFRAVGTQQKARTRQIKKLKKRGYGTGCDCDTVSRFVSRPYEGACDDIALIPKSTSSPPKGRKKTLNSEDSNTNTSCSTGETEQKAFSPPADEATLAKIKTAFYEWNARNQIDTENPFRVRKRSSSHSPPRTSSALEQTNKLSNSQSRSIDFLNHKGNLRYRSPTSRPGTASLNRRVCPAVASPATFRKRLGNTLPRVPRTTSKTLNSNLVAPDPPQTSVNRPRAAVTTYPSTVIPRNRRLTNIVSQEGVAFSSSLPDLSSKDSIIMNHTGHRPRSSSLKKPAAAKTTNSPKPPRKSNLKTKRENDTESRDTSTRKTTSSPGMPRRVMLNTSLPTASPTFQRAMKGMDLPEKDYSEIFLRNRRDSILQSYSIPENAFNSFRDDYELKQMESSSDAIEEISIRFKEDARIYKDGWDPKTEKKVRKSILKKRRQSVDDLEIGTRKNLAKYLESKLNMDGAGKLATKNYPSTVK